MCFINSKNAAVIFLQIYPQILKKILFCVFAIIFYSYEEECHKILCQKYKNNTKMKKIV